MPIYGYRCSSCGHADDEMQKMSDAPLSVCPKCGGETYVKQLSAAGFRLKGNGWYATDFKGGKATPKEDSTPAIAPVSAPASASAPTPCGGKCACH